MRSPEPCTSTERSPLHRGKIATEEQLTPIVQDVNMDPFLGSVLPSSTGTTSNPVQRNRMARVNGLIARGAEMRSGQLGELLAMRITGRSSSSSSATRPMKNISKQIMLMRTTG